LETGETAAADGRRRLPWGLVLLGVISVALCTWLAIGRHGAAPAPAVTAVAVSAARVTLVDVPVSIRAIGAAQAWQGVVIRPQVNGLLQRVVVREGSAVKAGALLAEINPAPYLALLTQAQGALRRDQAQLELARLDLRRDAKLAAQDSIAAEQVDTQRAQVKELEGSVLLDQGAVRSARVNLEYCRITAPVTGRVGLRLIDAGNLVTTAESNGIVTINQLKPIAVTFAVSQADFQRLSDASQAFGRPLTARAFNQDTGALLGTGVLTVTDNHVDPSTGTVEMKSRFANRDERLWPGQFVNVRITLSVRRDATTIPESAVNYGPRSTFAYVIGADHRVSARPITVEFVQGATAVIAAGLRPGQSVVTDGQMSLKPGSRVIVRAGAPGSAVAASRAARSDPDRS
jgi:membrane fusion protein, multidrug efflux system